jgi:lipopolysaccharide export system ATP-binding protein
VLDDLLTLFRRRRGSTRGGKPTSGEGRWRIDLQRMGGPIALGRSDRMPRAEQSMQMRAPYDDQAEWNDVRRRQPYDEDSARWHEPETCHDDGSSAQWHEPRSRADYGDGADRRTPSHRERDHRADRRASRPLQDAAGRSYLAAHAVEKSFGSKMVVRGASLYVRRGEAVGLLGPNGAGKTTIFYMITGLIKADRGRIELDGHDVTGLPMYQRARLGIGYLPQEASIFRGLNVEDNIRAVLEVVEPNRKQREHDLDSLLEEFDIARVRKTPSIALSGGERRRVEIARALATRPNYMLLDEPFAGIDPIAVGDLQTLVRHLTNRGIGVLITDHNVRETLGLTDRAYIIYSGEVLMEGRTEDIINNPDVRRLYLGEGFRL